MSTTTSATVSDGSTTQGQKFTLMEKASNFNLLTGRTKIGAESFLNQGNNLTDIFYAARALAKWEHSFTDNWKHEGSLGVHYLKNQDINKSGETPAGNLKLIYEDPEKLYWNVNVSHDYAFIDGYHPGAVINHTRITTINPWIEKRWIERLRTQMNSNLKYINDGNVKNDHELSTSYAFLKGPQTAWLGVGAQQISFSHNTSNYWSPTRIVNLGPRLEAIGSFTQFLKSTLRISFNRAYDQGPNAWGFGYYSYADLRYEKNNSWKIALTYERFETQVNHFLWFMNQLSLNAEALF